MSAVQKLLREREAYKIGLSTPAAKAPSVAVAAVAATPAAATTAFPSVKLPSIGQPAITGVITVLFYTSLVAFILFLILTFVHYTIRPIFQLSPTDNAILGSVATNDVQTAWDKEAKPDEKADFSSCKSCDITLSMDVYSSGDYTSIVAPKVFLYRADAAATIAANAKVSDLLTSLSSTNLIAYFDNPSNDLVVAAVTVVNNVKRLESSKPISNLPIKTPFRLTIVFTGKFFEVYINGKLRETVTLKGTVVESAKPFWSQPIRFDKVVRVAKLRYWPRPISATEIRNLEPVVNSNFFIQKT
jgi:hypothetical protein